LANVGLKCLDRLATGLSQPKALENMEVPCTRPSSDSHSAALHLRVLPCLSRRFVLVRNDSVRCMIYMSQSGLLSHLAKEDLSPGVIG
jgi:hypothetical protein